MSSFDPHLVTASNITLIEGQFTSMQCIDPANTFPGLSQGNLVMDPSRPFYIDVEWRLSGSLATLWMAALMRTPGGAPNNWVVEAYAESIGPGPEIQVGQTTVPVNPLNMTYSARINVGAGTLPEGNPGAAGPSGKYKLACSCFLNSSWGPPGYDITGFVEGPIVRIENPV